MKPSTLPRNELKKRNIRTTMSAAESFGSSVESTRCLLHRGRVPKDRILMKIANALQSILPTSWLPHSGSDYRLTGRICSCPASRLIPATCRAGAPGRYPGNNAIVAAGRCPLCYPAHPQVPEGNAERAGPRTCLFGGGITRRLVPEREVRHEREIGRGRWGCSCRSG